MFSVLRGWVDILKVFSSRLRRQIALIGDKTLHVEDQIGDGQKTMLVYNQTGGDEALNALVGIESVIRYVFFGNLIK